MLHLAALRGDVVEMRRVLDTGKVHVDCKDEVSDMLKVVFVINKTTTNNQLVAAAHRTFYNSGKLRGILLEN